MRHFLLFYEYGPDFEVRRAEVREQHLARAWAASARGELILAGALTQPSDTGVLLFRAEGAVTAEQFARSDPYVTSGLVTAWRVREWITAVGEDAASPVGIRQLHMRKDTMVETTSLKSQIDGFEFTALHASAEGARKGGVIVLQEVFGLDEAVRQDVARWAGLGFEVIAPSLFDRQQRGFVASHNAEGLEIGLRYATENGDDNPISDVQACIDALKDKGPVFLVGYCYGGTITWRAAARTSGLAAASSYYGAGVAASAEIALGCPIICHFGAKDPYIAADASVAAISAAHPDVPVYVYGNSGHGFNNEGPDADPADVRQARERTLQFFEDNAGRD